MPPPEPTSGLSALPELDRRILIQTNDYPGSSAEDIANAVSLSVAAARQHLLRLEFQGFVRHESPRERGKGRPMHLYHLTDAARQLFPQGSGYLLLGMLALLKRNDPSGYASVMAKLHEPFLEDDFGAGRLRSLPVQRRLEELGPWVAGYGHRARVSTHPNGFEVVVTHCPVLKAARHHPGICGAEARWLGTIFPEFHVQIAETMAAGASRCRIEFGPLKAVPGNDFDAAS